MTPYTVAFVEVHCEARRFAIAVSTFKKCGFSNGILALARMRLELACAVYRVLNRKAVR